ncbi:MAG: efflux RND transporter periplasmic adaptor subunit [Pelotomaculum sp.]|nr:efflux RND transporter periplasmic adaptor subunit [Pelotomaculum sp.]
MKCWRFVFLLVLAVALSGCGKKPPPAEEYIPPVETAAAAVKDLSSILDATGEVIASEEADVAPKVSGRVSTVNVSVGERVARGQALLVLESSEARNSVAQAEAAAGTAGVNVLKARQALADAERNYSRISALYQAQAVSRAQFEEAESALSNARLGLQLAEEQLRQAEAALAGARENLANHTVTSPIAGHVAAVNVHSGEMAGPQGAAVTVVNMDTVKVKVNVSENVISSIQKGSQVQVSIGVLGKTVTGTVVSVGPKSDPATRAFPVEIFLDNVQGEIRPGMVATLKIPVGTAKAALTVPAGALIERDGAYYVFTVEDGVAREKQVKPGVITDELAEIKEGLSEGAAVIVKGNRLVADGQKVKVVNAEGGQP